jgi:hypothetical protein
MFIIPALYISSNEFVLGPCQRTSGSFLQVSRIGCGQGVFIGLASVVWYLAPRTRHKLFKPWVIVVMVMCMHSARATHRSAFFIVSDAIPMGSNSWLNYFPVNLTDLHRSVQQESEYAHIPTLGGFFVYMPRNPITDALSLASGLSLSTSDILTNFILRKAGRVETVPFFDGFCGESVGDHVGSEQKCGSHVVVNHPVTKKVRSSFSRSSLSCMSFLSLFITECS